MVYDELGRPKTRTLIGSDPLTYIYDDLSRLVSIASGTTTYTYAYENQISPLIQSLTRPDQSVTGYTYDSLKRLTQIANKKSNLEIINQFDYQYNHTDFQLDQRSDEIVSGVTVPNPMQNETLSYQNNNLNQLLQITKNQGPETTNLIYDANGNLTQGYTPEGYEFTASYDAENRLKSLEYTDSLGIVHTVVNTYRADSFLVKLEKFENHVKMTEVNFIGEGFLPVQERDGDNNVIREYTWGQNMGGGIGGLLRMRYQGQDYSYLYDGKGNVTAVINSNQETVATYTYDEFGKVTSQTGILDQPFQFSTKRYDPDTGLNYYGYRFYSPALGRWINRDPIGEAGGVNLYEFVGNNPISRVDPLELQGIPGPSDSTLSARIKICSMGGCGRGELENLLATAEMLGDLAATAAVLELLRNKEVQDAIDEIAKQAKDRLDKSHPGQTQPPDPDQFKGPNPPPSACLFSLMMCHSCAPWYKRAPFCVFAYAFCIPFGGMPH